VDDRGGVRFDYRPVQLQTLGADVAQIPPKMMAY